MAADCGDCHLSTSFVTPEQLDNAARNVEQYSAIFELSVLFFLWNLGGSTLLLGTMYQQQRTPQRSFILRLIKRQGFWITLTGYTFPLSIAIVCWDEPNICMPMLLSILMPCIVVLCWLYKYSLWSATLAKPTDTNTFSDDWLHKAKLRASYDAGSSHSSGITLPNIDTACTICLEDYCNGDSVVWSRNNNACQHVFHEHCLHKWVHMRENNSDPSCPVCRRSYCWKEAPLRGE